MKYLSSDEEKTAMQYIKEAAQIALQSKCLRSRCGSVIVKNGTIIGRGFNSPPGNKTLDRCLKDDLPENFKSDKTCCVHAEQRAVMDALTQNPKDIKGSRLYFIRINDEGNIVRAEKPYCTVCSKITLDTGVSEFVLFHEKGICVYDTDEYNTISFQHHV